MLHFTMIRWKNFLSTGNSFTEVPLDKNQNTLVVGENGSGKSTLLDALCFALYNRPFRNINKVSLLNSINQKDAVVEVEFRTEHHNFKVIRGIKPNIFEIYKDGSLVNQNAESKDYQEHLERFILKLNYKSFTQIVILGSASFTPFMQLSSSDRRSVIEDLLDIQIFSIMNGLVKGKQSELTTKKNDNRILIEGASEKIAIQQRHIAEAKEDADKLIREYEHEISTHTAEITRLEMETALSKRSISDLQEKISDREKVITLSKKTLQLESQIELNLGKHKKSHKFFETQETCPTCAQEIEAAFKHEQLSQLTVKITECESGLQQLNVKYQTCQTRLSEIQTIEAEIQSHATKITEHATSMTQIKKFIKSLQAKISSLQTRHDSTEREQDRLQEHKNELQSLEDLRRTLIEELAYYDAANLLLKDTGIKTKIIRQYLPIINMMVNKYLATMDFFVNFTLDESFKETIRSRYRDDFSYASFSEGEKQRIDMALMLTWRAVARLKNSANTNLLILDEVFDSSLDQNGAEELMKILHHLDGTNVFVISHRGDILQDKFSHVIKFSKQQNFSRVVS